MTRAQEESLDYMREQSEVLGEDALALRTVLSSERMQDTPTRVRAGALEKGRYAGEDAFDRLRRCTAGEAIERSAPAKMLMQT